MSIVINLLYVMTKIPWLLVMLWRSSLILVVCLAWYKLLNEMSKWLFSGVELDSWLDGKRHLRIEKSNELIKGLQERIDELSKLNVQLEKEKEMLEKKLTVQPSRRDQGTCVEDKHPTEGKQETTKLIEEFKDQKENNKMILNKLEHLESLYTLITNKDDLVKELELYNQAKSKVTNLESEIMMFKCKNTEMKEKLNQMKAEIKQYEKLTSELKQNLKEEKNKNEECCKKYEELKDENDNLQSQVCNLSADLENIKKDDDMRNKYEHTKSLLELTNEKLETLKIDYETVKKELSDRNEKYICDHRMLKQELELAEKSKQEISAQYEITKLELKSSNDYVTELKSHYEILLTQLSKSNETIDDLNSKLNQAKVDLEHSSNKLDLMNSNLSETQETLTQLKLNLNDEIHNSKLYKDENERLMNKISVMENNKRTWEKEINALRLTLKKYRENEEKEMSKHTELVCEMTRKIEEFKHERIQLNYDIRELKRKIEELTKEKEEMSRKFEETQEKVLKQNDRALQEIQNEMKVKLESANEKIVQKDDKLEQIEDLYKARERELRLKYSRRETELKRQLETLTLNNSEIILERARLANEKLRLQQEMRDKSGAVPLNVYTLLDDPRTTTFPHASMSLAKGFANPKYSHGPVSLPLGFNSPSLLHDLTLFRPTNSTHKRQSNLKIMASKSIP